MGLVYNNASASGSIGSTGVVGIMNGTCANWYISNYPLGAMIEGDDETQQVGRKIRVKYINFGFRKTANQCLSSYCTSF